MAVLKATYKTYLCLQYWSTIVYNAEVAVKFSELPCIQNYLDLPYRCRYDVSAISYVGRYIMFKSQIYGTESTFDIGSLHSLTTNLCSRLT